MNIKVLRIIFRLPANPHNLLYKAINTPKSIVTVTSENQGLGQIKGITQKQGVIYPNVPISVFRRDNKLLLWETTSKEDGSYQLRNIAKGLECFVVGFDPASQFNAVISDKVVAK